MGKTLRSPPGFRFIPTDVELVLYHLKRKIMGKGFHFEAIAEVDIYKFAPWELPDKSKLGSDDLKWYFFCPVEKKYSSGRRINRATKVGCWKVTGKDSPVHHNKELVGSRKALVFYKGKAPQKERTDWVMHEYRLEDQYLAKEGVVQNKYVLCMIFQKEGLGPRNGAQYRAPFKEEDWNDDGDDDCAEAVPFTGSSTPTVVLPNNSSSSAAIGTTFLGGTISESCLSETVQSQCEGVSAVLNNNDVSNELYQVSGDSDLLPAVPSSFTKDKTLISNEVDKNKNLSHDENAEDALYLFDIYEGLGDLDNTAGQDFFSIADLDQLLDTP